MVDVRSDEETGAFALEESKWSPDLRAIPVPGIRRMINRAAELEDVVHLSIGQPNFETPHHIIKAHIEALLAGQTGYTMDAGLPELLTALATFYSQRYDRELTEDNFLITTGATEAIYLALTATAAPGREFIVIEPAFPLYAPLIRMHGGTVKTITTRADKGHQIDPREVVDAIGMNTFGIILNSPNNPTGAVYPHRTVEHIVREAAYRGIHVFSDEVYNNLVFDHKKYPTVLRNVSDLDHVMVMSSFSKTFSMAGLRIGWIVSSEGSIRKLRRYHMFTTTVANTPGQWAGVAAINGGRECVKEMVKGYRKRRDRVLELLARIPNLKTYKPQGAFYVFPELPPHVEGDALCMRMLEEIGVCTVPGSAFGDTCRNAFRISYSTSMENIEEAFERLIPWMEKQEF